jgi:hypothetical protein
MTAPDPMTGVRTLQRTLAVAQAGDALAEAVVYALANLDEVCAEHLDDADLVDRVSDVTERLQVAVSTFRGLEPT